jgi:ABC-2 type transport system ATP-binding protein
LNQGRKVFEGRVAEVRTARSRVALKTPDFAAATALLRERGMINGAAATGFITLTDDATISEVTRILVTAGIPVEGIWQREQTLEDFYLELVRPPPLATPTN